MANSVDPIVVQIDTEILPYQSPLQLASCFKDETGVILLHSAKPDSNLGQYSLMGVRPYDFYIAKNGWVKQGQALYRANIFDIIQQRLKQFQYTRNPALPPFQAGGMGYFSYDLNRMLERLPKPNRDDRVLPDCIFGLYDLVFAWDHNAAQLYLFSSGLPFAGAQARAHAKKRKQEILAFLDNRQLLTYQPEKISLQGEIRSHFDRDSYVTAVKKAIDYIYAGDIFEVNLSQRFDAQIKGHAFDLYYQLQNANPAPFSGFLNFDACQIISSSPERFLKIQDRQIETCPIKGTRPRVSDPIIDNQYRQDLITSAKDRAENIMIVDLMRNDLSRVSLPHTVKVPKLCELQSFATVHHLVSTVTGTLAPQYDAIDLLKATFPGGSITGAPKIRAMEIIAEIEPTARGPYCGSMGYIGFDGTMDLSILIRTFAMKPNWLSFQAGGAVTADSDPDAEYQETLDKAAALRNVLIKTPARPK